MRRLVAEIFDPATRYEYEPPLPADIARALELDAKFESLGLGLVDGLVAAVAERRRVFRLLTSDRRDFAAICVGPRLSRSYHEAGLRQSGKGMCVNVMLNGHCPDAL